MAALKSKFWQPDFDPNATFVVAAWPRGHTVNGVQPKSGEIFDKDKVSGRMLRAHYEARWINMLESLPALIVDGEVIGHVVAVNTALVDTGASAPVTKRTGRSRATSH